MDAAQVIVGFGKIRLESEGFFKAGDGGLRLMQLMLRKSQVVVGGGKGGFFGNYRHDLGCGLCRSAGFSQAVAEVVAGFDKIRVQIGCAAECLEGLCHPPAGLKDQTKGVVGLGKFGVYGYGLLYYVDGCRMIPHLKGDQAQKMPGLGVVGSGLNDLSVDVFRLSQAVGSVMFESQIKSLLERQLFRFGCLVRVDSAH